ncbi:hypothetical protein RIF29_32504 [Crotalaria pallida]|uniref:ADP-ribosyl cyclase/cyclic ADP-ribose hydrolase n=1 Tax=Crotalaria pallida TaxID=3830 RepID=A0AAN9EKR8_CROPI
MANEEGAVSQSKFSYDVFLSFRGEDTRHGFTGNLYNALDRAGIKTFMDDEELRVGEQIAPALLKAIEDSKIAVVVFSQNYAASAWCLDEFVQILRCHKEKNQIVFPIFYKVEPSDVRYQKNSYGEAMTKHESRFGKDSDKIRKWRSSLLEVSNLKGYHFREGYEYEYKLIREIVSEASIKVSPRSLDINEHIVGLKYGVEELKSILEIESNDTTCFLGIHGTGGIGKTTLAKALYNSICNQFESSCFLFNVRETSKQYEGQKLLLQTLLTKMLMEGTDHLASVDEGTKKIKRKLGQKRVLLVLDDVDDIKQLDILAGGRDWFGPGSKIIITTRDKHLLDAHEVKKIYEMKVLNDHDSLELFCQNAFKTSHPKPKYEELSDGAIRYAKGLPLALKVLGSHLCTKNLVEWRSALDKYERSPHKDIQSILRISYDGLESNEQDIFLDIACFFKGQRMEYVKTILDACDFFPGDGIRILVDRSLITVEDNCLMMHDLIQDMGREIVKEEKPKDAGKRSRLWFHEDVIEVLTEDTGSSKIEGIMLDPPQREEIHEWVDTALEKMKKLRILIVRNTSFPSAPSYLPNQLRLLDWKEYPSQSFPSRFNPKKIVALNLRGSLLAQPFQAFEHLTYMNVSNCHSLTQIPDVSGAKSLRELKLDGCEKLVIVDRSVGFLPNLVYLSVSGCFQLQSFVPSICLPSLEYLSFNLCRSLEHIPEIVGMMDKPLKINLIDTSIEELPHSISKLIGLEYLDMTSCNRLRYLPSSLFILPNLVTLKVGGCSRLPESFRRLEVSNSVRTLHFNSAGLLDEDLPVIIQSFPNLKDLNMLSNRFVSFPTCIQECICLTNLDVSECMWLEEIPELPSSVQKVNARLCNSLNAETLGMLWFQVCKEMKRLEVIMPRSREIPEWFDHCKEGGIPVFRARGKFPVVAVAFAFEKLNANGPLPSHWETVRLRLFIEGEHVHRKQYQTFYVPDNHVLLCDLRVMFSDEEWESLDALLHHQHGNDNNDWKTVQVVCETSMMLSSWGVYVYKQETNMDDIQFNTSPYHRLPSFSMFHKNRLLETSEEDKVRNAIEGMNVPVMFEGFLTELRAHEERGEFDNVGPQFHECNQSLLASLAKMSKRVTAQREGNGSGFNLEDEDDKEADNNLKWIAETILKLSKESAEEEEEKDKEQRQRDELEACPSYHVPEYNEDAIIIQRQLFDELVQANMTMPSLDHVANFAGPSYEPEYGEEVIIMERQLYDELVRANTINAASQDHVDSAGPSYHVPQDHDQGITPTCSDIGGSSGQSSKDDVIKVQYYIFDFTKQ